MRQELVVCRCDYLKVVGCSYNIKDAEIVTLAVKAGVVVIRRYC